MKKSNFYNYLLSLRISLKQIILFLLPFIFISSSSCKYYSQKGVSQDQYVNERFFHNKRNGVFIDVGAHDGKKYSNSYFFEKELGWNGICIEPLETPFQQLQKRRKCICVNACISSQEGLLKFFKVSGAPEMLSGIIDTYNEKHYNRLKIEIERDGGTLSIIEVPAYRLETLLEKHNIKLVDFLSIDTEGSELDILQSINFAKVKIHVICVENNDYCRTPEIKNFLISQGFRLVDYLKQSDEVYVNMNW